MSNRSALPLDKRQNMLRMVKAERKTVHLQRCSMQAKVHKAMQIIARKGKNGKSMNAALLAAHGLNPEAITQ